MQVLAECNMLQDSVVAGRRHESRNGRAASYVGRSRLARRRARVEDAEVLERFKRCTWPPSCVQRRSSRLLCTVEGERRPEKRRRCQYKACGEHKNKPAKWQLAAVWVAVAAVGEVIRCTRIGMVRHTPPSHADRPLCLQRDCCHACAAPHLPHYRSTWRRAGCPWGPLAECTDTYTHTIGTEPIRRSHPTESYRHLLPFTPVPWCFPPPPHNIPRIISSCSIHPPMTSTHSAKARPLNPCCTSRSGSTSPTNAQARPGWRSL